MFRKIKHWFIKLNDCVQNFREVTTVLENRIAYLRLNKLDDPSKPCGPERSVKSAFAYHRYEDDLGPSRAEKFVQHIEAHLKPGQVVVCKICGKSIDEITKSHG